MTIVRIQSIPNLYLATMKTPRLYISATGKTRSEAIDRALSEYFRPF